MAQQSNIRTVHLAIAMLALFLTLTGAVWGMISVHAQTPHEDAVHRQEWALIRVLMQAEHEALRQSIENLRKEIQE